MKIRIQDHSVRYRISLKELDTLNRNGRIDAVTEIYAADGVTCEGRFSYAVAAAAPGTASRCAIEPGAITLYLDKTDRATLNDSDQEGVYLQREVKLASGEMRRFMAFIEKDRPSANCPAPDVWIYQGAKDAAAETQIPSLGKGFD